MTCSCRRLGAACGCRRLGVACSCRRPSVTFVCRRCGAAFICVRAIQMSKVYPISNKKSNQWSTICYKGSFVGKKGLRFGSRFLCAFFG